MVEMPEAHPEDSGRNLRTHGQGAPNVAARREPSRPEESELIDAVVERENMKRALRRVHVFGIMELHRSAVKMSQRRLAKKA